MELGGKEVLRVSLGLVPHQMDHISTTSWLNNQICIHHWALIQTMAAASVEATALPVLTKSTAFPQFRKSCGNRIMGRVILDIGPWPFDVGYFIWEKM